MTPGLRGSQLIGSPGSYVHGDEVWFLSHVSHNRCDYLQLCGSLRLSVHRENLHWKIYGRKRWRLDVPDL